MTHRRYRRGNFMARELAAFAWLRTLRNFDLQLVCINQIIAGYSETSRRHLFYAAVARVAIRFRHVAFRVLASLACIASAAETIHGDREGLVRFPADRTVRHRTGLEPFDDLRGRFNLGNRNGTRQRFKFHQSPESMKLARLVVYQRAELFECVVVVGAAGMLKFMNRLRVELVQLSVTSPLILTAFAKRLLRFRPFGESLRVHQPGFFGDDFETDPANS